MRCERANAVRTVRHWRAAGPFERLQLTPVYVSALLTFLLVTIARSGAGEAAWWAAVVAAWLTPFAFLGGLLRRRHFTLTQRYYTRYEVEWLLRCAGFEAPRVTGSFQGGPLEEASEVMVFQTRAR